MSKNQNMVKLRIFLLILIPIFIIGGFLGTMFYDQNIGLHFLFVIVYGFAILELERFFAPKLVSGIDSNIEFNVAYFSLMLCLLTFYYYVPFIFMMYIFTYYKNKLILKHPDKFNMIHRLDGILSFLVLLMYLLIINQEVEKLNKKQEFKLNYHGKFNIALNYNNSKP